MYSTEFYPTAQYTWTASPNLSLSTNTGTTVTASPNQLGSAWIEVNVVLDPSCPNSHTKTIRRELWVGLPETPTLCVSSGIRNCTLLSVPYNLSFCRFEPASVRVLSSGAEGIAYSVNGGAIVRLQNGELPINTSQVGTFVYNIASANPCGISPIVVLTLM